MAAVGETGGDDRPAEKSQSEARGRGGGGPERSGAERKEQWRAGGGRVWLRRRARCS